MSDNDLNGFDANNYEPQDDYSAIPVGEYSAILTESEWRDTKANDGRYLEFVAEILDGEFEGRKIWDNLNLENKSEKAVEIANRTLSSICRAVGVMRPKSSDELLNKPLVIKVGTEEWQGKIKNKIKAYKPLAGGGDAPAKKDNENLPPWKRK